MNKGIAAALSAYLAWGIIPIYWKTMESIPAYEIICHRIIWSLIFLIILLILLKDWKWLKEVKANPRLFLTFILSATLISINWLTYIWAVNSGYIVDASLGYFINPLVNVFLGVVFLRERLRLFQWLSIIIAASGVLYLTMQFGQLPWIALTLAFTFGLYGLIRKTAALNSIEGLSLEMAILLIPAISALGFFSFKGAITVTSADIITKSFLVSTGVITAIPLLLFAYGARRVTLTTLGLLQYTAPSMQLFVGIYIYDESFTVNHALGFGLIWISLFLYSMESIIVNAKRKS